MEKIDFKKQNIPFTQVANGVIYDKRLSLGAKTIYTYMYSKPDGWDFASDRIAKELNVSKPTILKHIKELKESGYLISKKLSNGRILYKIIFPPIDPEENIFTLGEKPKSKKASVKKSLSEKSLPISNKEFKVIKNISNKDTSDSKESHDIAFLIKKFEEVDVKNKRFYGNKTQRSSAQFLIEQHGLDKVVKVIDFYLLAKKRNIEFLPTITSPYELVEKWSKLENVVKREFSKKDNVVW